jgi:putative tricarboxylic transport membrane protein
MKRVRTEAIGSLFWLVVGIFFAVGGILLKLGTLRNPGPGFLPLMMASLLVAFSLFVFFKGLIESGTLLKGVQWRRQAVLVVSVFLYGLLLGFAGFLLSTFILMFVVFALFFEGKGRWPKVLSYAVLTALIGWLVFSVALKVPFPRGTLMSVLR